MKTIFHKAESRGFADYGWLKTKYSFSFANYSNPEKVHFGLLRVLNDDYIGPGEGFGMHPHDNMEIVTIITKGELEHKDSMGHTSIMRQNDVQVMTAGTGIFHSEFNHSKTEPLELFQIWIFTDAKNHTPRYDQKSFDPSLRKNQWQMLVTPAKDGLYVHQQAWFALSSLHKDQRIDYKFHKKDNGVYIFNVGGRINTLGEAINRRDAIGIWETTSVEIEAEVDSDILLIEIPMK
jgi:quercetin 2,3-dioxygenase